MCALPCALRAIQVEARRLWHCVYKRAFRYPGSISATCAASAASAAGVLPAPSRPGASAAGCAAPVVGREFLDFVLQAVRDLCSEQEDAGSRRRLREDGGATASYSELETVVRQNGRSGMQVEELPRALAQLVDLSCVYVVDEGWSKDGRERQYRPIRA
jgi:hypothetical protein